MIQWPGVKLRVTEAWDDLSGSKFPARERSLHYEGDERINISINIEHKLHGHTTRASHIHFRSYIILCIASRKRTSKVEKFVKLYDILF